jgi:hypothetical protein
MILQAIQISNKFYLNNFFKIFNTCALSVITISALSIYTNSANTNSLIVVTIMSTLLQIHLTGMLMLVTADIINNSQQSTINYYIKSLFYIISLGVVGLIVGIVLILGFVAFIIPGIFLLGKLIFAQYFLILKGKGIVESLELSWKTESNIAWNLGLTIFIIVLIWGLFIGLISSLFLNDQGALEPFFIFLTSISSFVVLNIYLNIFLIHLFIIEGSQ